MSLCTVAAGILGSYLKHETWALYCTKMVPGSFAGLVDVTAVRVTHVTSIGWLCMLVTMLLQDSREYEEKIHKCHQRAANRIVNGALRNGGLYIKLGQGLGSFNHVLPREYIDSLAVLQDLVSVCRYGSR